MPQRICKVAHWYGGRDRVPGETFEVESQDIGLQLALGRIEPEDEAPKVAQSYMTRDMTARTKRPYNRKAA